MNLKKSVSHFFNFLSTSSLSVMMILAGSPSPSLAIELTGDEDTVSVSPEKLHPTQFNLGMLEVQIRKDIIEELRGKPSKLKEYLEENAPSAVIGPEQKLYLIDGHHITRAVMDLGFRKIETHILKDYSDRSTTEFWRKLKDKEWTYLHDRGGPQRPYSELPPTVAQLTDDPYRTLAWVIRKVGGYEKSEIPFAEFKWANFFRKKIPTLELSTRESFRKAVEDALRHASSYAASDLPGYLDDGPDSLDPIESRKSLQKYLELEQRLFPDRLPRH